jgi:dihydrodipicolinate synthase/N-acetylneuraminate lyase
MAKYSKSDARAWAREKLIGTSSVTIPTMTADHSELNEKAIRHDIGLGAKHGFTYTLLCSEIAITVSEYVRFTAWARDTVGTQLGLIFHAAFGTLAQNIEAARACEKAGADLALLAYPSQFHPTSENEIYDYTRSFCDATSLGVMLFPMPSWGFERVHPAGMSNSLMRRLVDDIPNVVAIKAEQGLPAQVGLAEMHRLFAKEVVISCPIEANAIPLMPHIPIQFSGTSNTEYYADRYPRAFDLARKGRQDEAMELYWKIHPARQAKSAAAASYAGAGMINRALWKYQSWLVGYNGGPLRAPVMRVHDRFKRALRKGLIDAGIEATSDPDKAFYEGRHPA